MPIGYAVKHNRLPLGGLLFSRRDSVLSQKSVEVGAVDVDFTTYLREGYEALVAIILPCLWRDSRNHWTDCRTRNHDYPMSNRPVALPLQRIILIFLMAIVIVSVTSPTFAAKRSIMGGCIKIAQIT